MLSRVAVSPAANRWQQGLLRALVAFGQDVEQLGWLPEPAWPHGELWVDGRATIDPDVCDGRIISYLNLPFLRVASEYALLLARCRRLFAQRGRPAVVLSYNAAPANVLLALQLQRLKQVPWVPVIADGPAWGARWHEPALAQARGRAYLSYGTFAADQTGRAFHLDGGVQALRNPAPPQETRRAFLFAGVLNQYAGVDLALAAFRQLEVQDVELWICGKGDTERLRRETASDGRITVFGGVPERQLEDLSRQAWAFLNPRPPDVAGNEHNFPSKVLEYLSYGKPVISTWTAGLAPVYREVLTVVESATPSALARGMAEILEWPPAQRDAVCQRIATFVEEQRLWSVQARRLHAWIGRVILRR